MALLITFIYIAAASVSGFILLRRMDVLLAWVFVLSILSALDAQDWMIPWLPAGPVAWPARNIAEVFVAALNGIEGSTSLGELAVVAGGRLLALLGLFYALFFVLNYGAAWRALFVALPASTRALIALWGGSWVLALMIQVFGPDLAPFATIARVTGATGAFLLAANALMVEVRKKGS